MGTPTLSNLPSDGSSDQTFWTTFAYRNLISIPASDRWQGMMPYTLV